MTHTTLMEWRDLTAETGEDNDRPDDKAAEEAVVLRDDVLDATGGRHHIIKIELTLSVCRDTRKKGAGPPSFRLSQGAPGP